MKQYNRTINRGGRGALDQQVRDTETLPGNETIFLN